MPTPLEELPDIQLDDEEEEAGDVRWRPLWQQSLERMSTSSSKPSLSSSSASSPSGGPGRQPLGAKDAYIRTPGGGRMRLDAAAQHHQPPPPRASSSSVARGAVSSSSPPLKSQQHKPSAHLSANRAGSRMGPAPLLPSRGRGAPPSGGDGGPHRGAGGRGASAGGVRALPGPLRQAQQAKPHDDVLDEMAGLGDDAEVSKPQHPPVSWDRQKLIKEMVALPRSKKAYLLRMLEDMEKELQTEAAAAAGGGGALHHHEGGGEESRHGGMEGRDPASASPSCTESGEDGGGGLGLLREKVGWSKEAGGAYPAEVLKIWARVQKLRPHPHHPTHHHHNKPRNNNNNSKPASSSSPPRPQQEAAKAHQARPQMVGPSVLRDRLVADFDVRLAPREVTVLMKHFATTNNHPTNESEVDYREVASFLRQTRISSSSNTHHAAAAPGTSSSSTGSGGPIDSSSGSRGSQPPARRRPLHQEEAARSVLSVPPDEASRALLEKIAAVAARTNRQELGAVFRADESRRSVLVPPQEFKALLWTGLQLRLAPHEFDLLLQWFGNGLHDKSAAIDLALFSQQFWALGSAAKTRRRKEEAQDRFIRALSTKPRHRPPPTTTSSTSPAVANQQDEQHGGGGGPSPPSVASPVASPSGSDCYDDDDFEDERSVNSHHHNNASSSHHSAHTGLSTRHPW